MGVRFEEIDFASFGNGHAIPVLLCVPEGAPKAILQMAHGMAEHKARYRPLMQAIAGAGYVVALNDHPGHGASVKTAADLGHFSADEVLDDMRCLSLWLRDAYPGLPLFLMGHSMGSLAARYYLRMDDSELSGLILTGSPRRNPLAGAGLVLLGAMRLVKGARHRSAAVDRIINGAVSKGYEGFDWLCSDEAEVRKYNEDPLCGFLFTLKGYCALLTLMRRGYAKRGFEMAQPGLPVLLLSGADDPCLGGAERMDECVRHLKGRGYRNVVGKTYPGMRHEIMRERGWAQVAKDIVGFMSRHEGAPPPLTPA